MDIDAKTTATDPTTFAMIDAAQMRETYEKVNTVAAETANLIKSSYSTAVQGLQDYNRKLIEFGHENASSAIDFFQKLSAVKSPRAFVELATEQAGKQFQTLTEQARQLTALAQTVTLATAEPLKTGVVKALDLAA
jgi:phasin